MKNLKTVTAFTISEMVRRKSFINIGYINHNRIGIQYTKYNEKTWK